MYCDQEDHTFHQDVSHALVPYEPPVSDKSRVQKRHPFLRGADIRRLWTVWQPLCIDARLWRIAEK